MKVNEQPEKRQQRLRKKTYQRVAVVKAATGKGRRIALGRIKQAEGRAAEGAVRSGNRTRKRSQRQRRKELRTRTPAGGPDGPGTLLLLLWPNFAPSHLTAYTNVLAHNPR
ncbi:hypothetical protein Sgleb_49040 [Streptomyces glebosus]|uniref:Uncharacterized protein n=1 Tax=Streptomyces glebosus TaxID=249580 RepID=A0A640SZI1_9ACTN|nr:hypothetical protein Sgleb_49040 [Streptomyces glebosus]GHG86432.1 hypothetical protein GCM10010513_67710 [Streptomyces glebosus]